VRRPSGSFGWLEDRLLHERWLARLGAEGISVLVLLALAADRHGASFYGRDRMALSLALSRAQVDEGLRRLLSLGLVAHRPWRTGSTDGVWQLLPVPAGEGRPRRAERPDPPSGEALPLSAILARLGFTSPPRPSPPESRGS
jgi:hypothetical protein